MLIGHGSSGTSILAILLRKYLQVCFGTESQFIVHYDRRLGRYGDLAVPENMRRLASDILQERWFVRSRKFGFRPDLEDILGNVKKPTYRALLDAIFGQFARQSRMQRWGDKTPEYTGDLDVLGKLFPEAKYIHIVRDGRDVAHSTAGRYWGPKNAYVSARQWEDTISNVLTFIRTLPPDQVLEVRYEDLLTHPRDVFRKLIRFLEIDDGDGALIAYIDENVAGDLMPGNFNKWQNAWSHEEQLRFERVACDNLRRYGYETTLTRCDDTFPGWQRLYWRLTNRLRKWMYPRYWADNFYKAKLRLRDLWRRLRRKPKAV